MNSVNVILLGARGILNLILGAGLIGFSVVIARSACNGARDVLANFIFGFGLLYLTLSIMGFLRTYNISSVCGVEVSAMLFIPMIFTVYCIIQGIIWIRDL